MKNKFKDTQYTQAAADKFAHAKTLATEKLNEQGKKLKKTEKRVLKGYSDFTRHNPVTSLSIAMAAGFMLNLVLSSR